MRKTFRVVQVDLNEWKFSLSLNSYITGWFETSFLLLISSVTIINVRYCK